MLALAGAGLAAANRTTILSMIARAQMPPVEDNRAVNWAQGPQTYLGLTVAGFPNLFTITGPVGSETITAGDFVSIAAPWAVSRAWFTSMLKAAKRATTTRAERKFLSRRGSPKSQEIVARVVGEAVAAVLLPQVLLLQRQLRRS